MKILISPWVFSGMFDPDNNTFSIWWKLCLADFLTNFYQMMLVILVLAVTPAVPISALAKVIFFIGALSAVMNAPTGIAQLLGGDVGVGTAFQQMQSLGMISSAMSGIGGMAAGAALTMGAGAIYGGGRLAGGTGLLHSAGEALGGLTGGSGGILAGIGNTNGSEGGSTSPLGQFAPSQVTTGGVPGLDDSNMPQSSVNPSMLSGLGSGEGTPRRMTKDGNSIARRIADMNSNSRIGRMVNQAGSSLYQMSANRLSRPVQTRTRGGMIQSRQSHVVTAARAAHRMYDAAKGGSNE